MNIEIDGKTIEAHSGETIIQVADRHGIAIPRFCYHPKLSIVANCRMCLVEVENAKKPMPACATPINEGMKVFTKSKMAKQAQKAVMEFLLINHPLDCPICDQGGECDLQDQALTYGSAISRFTEGKRAVQDKNLGPLISTEMTRCIHCTRCIRVCEEIAGKKELGATGRGEHMEIGTFIERSLSSPLSSNVIEVCPVGALTSKPYRFTARGWELKQIPGIAPHDCLGSHVFLHTRRHKLMRVVPKKNDTINEVWLSDRDRFSYLGVHHENRLIHCLTKKEKSFLKVEFKQAMKAMADNLKKIIDEEGSEQIGVLVSPTCTLEECFLISKLCSSLGISNLDYRLTEHTSVQIGDPLAPVWTDFHLMSIHQQEALLLVGSDVLQEQPVLSIRLRELIKTGGTVSTINPVNFEANMSLKHVLIPASGNLVVGLAEVLKGMFEFTSKMMPEMLKQLLAPYQVSEQAKAIAKQLCESEKKTLLLGHYALSHPESHMLYFLANRLKSHFSVAVGVLTEGPNSAGACLAGCVPASNGLDMLGMLNEPRKAYLLFNWDPAYDCANTPLALKAFQKADQVIAFSGFQTKGLEKTADWLIPWTVFGETDGTYVNIEGKWQSFEKALQCHESVQPGWQCVQELAKAFELEGFGFENTSTILSQLKETVHANKLLTEQENVPRMTSFPKNSLLAVKRYQMATRDMLTRHAESLQKAHAVSHAVWMNTQTAKKYDVLGQEKVKLKTSHGESILPLLIEDKVGDAIAWIVEDPSQGAMIGLPYTPIEIEGV